jgi:hypothetical protein
VPPRIEGAADGRLLRARLMLAQDVFVQLLVLVGVLVFDHRQRDAASESSPLILLKVLRLFKDLFVDLIAVHGRIAVLGEEEDQVDFEPGFDVGALAPGGVFGFVVDDRLHLLGELDQLVLGVVEIVLMRSGNAASISRFVLIRILLQHVLEEDSAFLFEEFGGVFLGQAGIEHLLDLNPHGCSGGAFVSPG